MPSSCGDDMGAGVLFIIYPFLLLVNEEEKFFFWLLGEGESDQILKP